MFWLFMRAMIAAAAGGLIVLIFMIAADPIIETLFSVQSNPNSRNAYWGDQAITWLPAVVFAAIAIKVLAGATVRRGVR